MQFPLCLVMMKQPDTATDMHHSIIIKYPNLTSKVCWDMCASAYVSSWASPKDDGVS